MSSTPGAKIVHALRLQHRLVAGEVTRITRQIFVRAELQGIDEDRGNDDVVVGARPAGKLHVADMQITHSGHEADRAAVQPVRRERRAQIRDGGKGLHRRSSLLSPSPAGDTAPSVSCGPVRGGADFYLVQRKKTIAKHLCRLSRQPMGRVAVCALDISAKDQ